MLPNRDMIQLTGFAVNIKRNVLVSSPVSLSDNTIESAPSTIENAPAGSENAPADSMQDFYKLYQELLVITLALTGIIFVSVWVSYSLNIALNYLIGGCAGLVYLRMLAKDVERLGREKQQLSKTRLALLVLLILLAGKWNQLEILPIFLGFLTYKATLIIYVIRVGFNPD
jgi:ATP synthase protein I